MAMMKVVLWMIFDGICRLRLGWEDFRMKTLRTNSPHGLNERSKDFIPRASIGRNFYPIKRTGKGINKYHKNQGSQPRHFRKLF